MTTTPFTAQDLALVALIAEGLGNRDIALKLGLTRDRVSATSGALILRHQCGDRAGLVAVACRGGQLPRCGRPRKPLPWREADVLACVADGLTNPQTADRLFLSVDAVKSRVRLLLKQLGATDRANAVWIAHRAGLLPEAGR